MSTLLASSAETFGIGELSRRTGVPAPTIRTWQARGLQLGRRTLGGHRRFTEADVERVSRFVVLIRDADHTIAGAIAKLCAPGRTNGHLGATNPSLIVPRAPMPPPPAPRLRLTGLLDAVQALIEMAATSRRVGGRVRADTLTAQLSTVAQRTASALRADLAAFLLRDGAVLRPYTASGPAGSLLRQPLPFDVNDPVVVRVLEHGRVVRLEGHELARGWFGRLARDLHAQVALLAPMEHGGEPVGLALLLGRNPADFTPDAGEMLLTVSGAVAAAALLQRAAPPADLPRHA